MLSDEEGDFLFTVADSTYKRDLKRQFWGGYTLGFITAFMLCLFIGVLDYVGLL